MGAVVETVTFLATGVAAGDVAAGAVLRGAPGTGLAAGWVAGTTSSGTAGSDLDECWLTGAIVGTGSGAGVWVDGGLYAGGNAGVALLGSSCPNVFGDVGTGAPTEMYPPGWKPKVGEQRSRKYMYNGVQQGVQEQPPPEPQELQEPQPKWHGVRGGQ